MTARAANKAAVLGITTLMKSATSRLLSGRYRLGTFLGEGAMSTVSCAHDELLQRTVAIKLLKPAYGKDDAFVARFYAEARAAAKIVHQHVVAIYDIVADGTALAIAMEYVDGGSLADRLDNNRRIAEAQTIDYLRQTAQALAAAHAHGLLHRDIKPANLLLTKTDVLKVADFGLAKAIGPNDFTITQPGEIVGSVHYFSPEQAKGEALSPASDLYSLGIVAYQMLAGDVPFRGDSAVTVALAHIQQEPPTLEALQSIASAGLARIVHRLLQKDPALRYASAVELDAALADCQTQHAPAYALDAPTVVMSAPPVTRTPVPAARSVWQKIVASSQGLRRARLSRRALLAGIAGVIALIWLVSAAFAQRVTVADVRNTPLAWARRTLQSEHLIADVTTRSDRQIREGNVIAQSPAARTSLRRGDHVALVVSAGLPTVAIPNVVGQTLAFAQNTFGTLRLRTTYAARISDTQANEVIEQFPAAGTRVRELSPTLIVISTGPQPRITYGAPGPGRGRGHGHGRGHHHGED